MRGRTDGWRVVFSGIAVLFAVVVGVFTLLNFSDHPDWAEASLWLGGGSVLLLISIAFLFRESTRLALAFSVFAGVAGLVAVAGYLLAYNGVSELAARAGFFLIDLADVHMSGALCLVIASGGVVATTTSNRHGFGRETAAAAGLVVGVLVLAMLLGQHFRLVPLEAEVLAQRLLPMESVVLLLTGFLLFVHGCSERRSRFDWRNRFLPSLAFVGLLAASLHLWLVLVGEEELMVHRQTVTTADRLAATLEEHLEERLLAFDRLAKRMVAEEHLVRMRWAEDAANFLQHFESISAIGWITPDGYIRWAMSRDDPHYREGELYAVDERRRLALETARAGGEMSFSDPLPLRAGGYGQIVALPLIGEDDFRGWLVVGQRFEELFADEIGNVAPYFSVRIFESSETVFSRIDDPVMHPRARPVMDNVSYAGLEWQLEIWPASTFFAALFMWLPSFMLLLGVIAAGLFGVSLYQLEAQRRYTGSLRASEERYRLTAEQTGEIVYDYHVPSGHIEWLGAIREMTGETPADFAAVDITAWERRVHPDDAERVMNLLHQAEMSLQRFVSEYRFRRRNGSYVLVEDRGVFLPGPDGRAERMLGTIADVTQRHEFEQQLRYLAHFDQQTGLRNRVWFMEEAVRRAEVAAPGNVSLWFVFLDVDRFRAVNETLGHVVGDLLLEGVARRLESVVDERGELARLGGDEFGLCLLSREVDRAAMSAFCEELTREFSQPFAVGGHSLFVTLSVGISRFPNDGDDVQQVIRAAETAMFRAKQRGRNTYAFYETSMSVGARENLEIANSLRRALEQDEFHLEFQPRYSMSTGRITGMEALLRWENDALGRVSPASFIPVAEETGLIGPIGWYVVEAAAAAARRLGSDLMLGRRIAINVSARQLIYTDFVTELVARVEAAGARPQWFEVELTESLVMEDPERARELFVRLHTAGFTISIDDFGTGYSSLSYLKHFPVDNLKIDRSFVMGLPDNQDDASIVRTIIAMGQGLGLRLIAEGIETEAQGRFLREAGCEEAQGFLFARPMPLAQLSSLLD